MDDTSADDIATIAERRRLGIYVPDVENRVADRFGEDVARRFLSEFGGESFTIPDKLKPGNRMVQVMGLPFADWFREEFGPRAHVHIPWGPFAQKTKGQVRLNRLIMAMPGCLSADIAHAAGGFSVRQVRRARHAMRLNGVTVPPTGKRWTRRRRPTPAVDPKSAQGSPCVRETASPAPGTGEPRDGV